MNREKFKELVVQALDELPEEFTKKFDNIEVTIENLPGKDISSQLRLDHHSMLLGLYQGVPLTKRSIHYGMVLPDKITLFQKNIESVCHSNKDIKKQVQKTVIHEVGHYFGLSEKKIKALEKIRPRQ